ECFCPSCFPTTRENTQFSKNTFPRPQKLVFKPSEFLDFVSEPKNKPRLKVLKRGLIFKTIFQKRGLCNGYRCYPLALFRSAWFSALAKTYSFAIFGLCVG